jgi:hypothetical protein
MRVLSATAIQRYRSQGFVVLRGVVDPAPLAQEVDEAFDRGFAHVGPHNVSAEAAISFRYLPLMSERTPVSLELLGQLRPLAEQLLGTPVLPIRAKAVEYHGASSWHRDSDLDVASVGFACYLSPLTAETGALRVVPGSHRDAAPPEAETTTAKQHAVETAPGDVIVFDEHLVHASQGGALRRQWRTDFIARPTTAAERATVTEYFTGMFSPDWDGGYDTTAYPTYGPHWQHVCPSADDALLEALGAYAAAAAEEDAARERRSHAAADR